LLLAGDDLGRELVDPLVHLLRDQLTSLLVPASGEVAANASVLGPTRPSPGIWLARKRSGDKRPNPARASITRSACAEAQHQKHAISMQGARRTAEIAGAKIGGVSGAPT